MTASYTLIAGLAITAFFAGVVDAIAGGGGLLTVSALLATGLPPHVALGTNKGQSVFGSGAALLRFARHGAVDRPLAKMTFPAGLAGAFAGAALLLALDPKILRPIVPFLLVAAGVVVAVQQPSDDAAAKPPRRYGRALAVACALLIGVYDGFFGPGTGTFLLIAFVATLRLSLPRATADAKVVNFASNLASVLLFSYRGTILWSIALPMAVGQFLGGITGAHLAIRGGSRFIRSVVLLVVAALVLKLAHDVWG
jgi:uncharacterized membrane protein YfcA